MGGERQLKDDGDHRAKKISSFLIHFHRKAPQVCLCCPKRPKYNQYMKRYDEFSCDTKRVLVFSIQLLHHLL